MTPWRPDAPHSIGLCVVQLTFKALALHAPLRLLPSKHTFLFSSFTAHNSRFEALANLWSTTTRDPFFFHYNNAH